MTATRKLLLTLPRLDRGQVTALFDLCGALQGAVRTAYESELIDEAMERTVADARRRGSPRPVAHLSGQEAYALVHTLEMATRALWKAYGDQIVNYLCCVDPEAMENWTEGGIVSDFPAPDGDPDLDF